MEERSEVWREKRKAEEEGMRERKRKEGVRFRSGGDGAPTPLPKFVGGYGKVGETPVYGETTHSRVVEERERKEVEGEMRGGGSFGVMSSSRSCIVQEGDDGVSMITDWWSVRSETPFDHGRR